MIAISQLDTAAENFAEAFGKLLLAGEEPNLAVQSVVREIINDVRKRGDAAVLEYTRRFDRRRVERAEQLTLSAADLDKARERIPDDLRTALERAADRIRDYHLRQVQDDWSFEEPDGTVLGQKVTPLDRVGVYVPGGKAAYPSSVLMNVIPAKVAGVGEIVMVVPTPDDQLEPVVLAAAAIAGVDRVFTIGGAQAVAALAYGTETVPAVDKIVGPGNAYVAAAKAMVFGRVGIDMIAGPSEILVVCDGSTEPDWVAMDLFSQAEHDEQARAMVVSPDRAYLQRVLGSVERLLPGMERAGIIRTALESNGAFIACDDLDEAIDIVNRIAPEHLELSLQNPMPWLEKVRHAGAIFLGHHTAEVLGDYCAGPNHVLPTAGTARFSSPLGVYDFQKRSSVVYCSAAAAQRLGRTAALLATSEGLTAHARSAAYRVEAQD
jgi:histidinol dehydrogenase